MQRLCPNALFLNYTNPMAMLSGYMQRYTGIRTVGLCHSVRREAAEELARDSNIDPATLRYRCAGINHMAFYLELERKTADAVM